MEKKFGVMNSNKKEEIPTGMMLKSSNMQQDVYME